MEEYNEFVPNVHFELIPIKSLVSNQDYQRNLSMQHMLAAEILATETAAIRTNFAAESVSQILAK